MLKVTLHNSTPSRASDRNVLGRLDIGYAKLDARADYKAVMFIAGVGEQRPVQLLDYPRWSASVWDLVTRVLALRVECGAIAALARLHPRAASEARDFGPGESRRQSEWA